MPEDATRMIKANPALDIFVKPFLLPEPQRPAERQGSPSLLILLSPANRLETLSQIGALSMISVLPETGNSPTCRPHVQGIWVVMSTVFASLCSTGDAALNPREIVNLVVSKPYIHLRDQSNMDGSG